jgi:hypothetical protein
LLERSPVTVAGHRLRREDFDIDHRLEDDRLGGANRFDRGLAGGSEKGDVLAVDRVRLAVVDGDAQILDREAGDDAVGQRLANALLDRGHEDSRNDATLDDIDELEAGAAFERFDAQHATSPN